MIVLKAVEYVAILGLRFLRYNLISDIHVLKYQKEKCMF